MKPLTTNSDRHSFLLNQPLDLKNTCPKDNVSFPINPLIYSHEYKLLSENSDHQINALKNLFTSVIQSHDTGNDDNIKSFKTALSTFYKNCYLEKSSQKKEQLLAQFDKLNQAFSNYQSIKKCYNQNTSKLDNLSQQLTKLSEAPTYGLTPEILDIIENQINTLQNLVDLSDRENLDCITKLVEAEITEVNFYLEEWQESYQNGIKELLPNAIAVYTKLLTEPMPDKPIKALYHYHNILLARQRLVILQKWSVKLQKFLPYKNSFIAFQEKFDIANIERVDLSDLDKIAKTIKSQIDPLLKKPLPPFPFLSAKEMDTIQKTFDTEKALDAFDKESLLHILKDPTLESWKDFIEKKVYIGKHTLLLFERLDNQEKSFFKKCFSWLGNSLYNISNPDLFSDTTKKCIYNFTTLMQLTSQGIAFSNKIGFFQNKTENTADNMDDNFQNNLQPQFHSNKDIFYPKQDLRQKAELFYNALEKSVEKTPQETCPVNMLDTRQSYVEEKCYAIKDLENQMTRFIKDRVGIDRYGLNNDSDLDAFGNKYKNLIKQARLANILKIPNLEVPIPRGISSKQIKDFLEKTSPEIFTNWQKLQQLYEQHTDKTSFFKTDGAKQSLNIITQEIQKAFEKAAKDDDTFAKLGLSEDFISWLKAIDDKGNYLMIRSTGAEDSRKAANAGGNLSESYVKANQSELCQALGNVVSSYFGVNSLQNRINAGINPFKEDLMLAVTSQELIGEDISGVTNPFDIPISLVLFSNDPLYVGDEKFRVIRISATYGHGAGVVGNLGINTDTVLVLNSVSEPDKLYILYDNQKKTTRLAPIYDENEQKVMLKKIKNPDQLTNRQTLSSELIARLYYWAVSAESYFEDEATDMEIVIKNNKIYPVQARPINRKPLLPTYLDLKKVETSQESLIQKSLKTKMLVVGKGSAFEIKNHDEILLANTLEEAEKLYIKDKHKLVIVYQSEPANSHPVVNFSSLGVPCLYATDRQEIEDLLSKISDKNSLAVCMQSSTLHLWNNEKAKLNDFISKGFTSYPVKMEISLSGTEKLPKQIETSDEIPQDVKELITRITTAASQKVALENLENLKKHLWLQKFKEQTLALKNENPGIIKPTIKNADVLDKKINQAFLELETILKSKNPSRLKSLFHIKVLETLLFAEKTSPQALDQYSVISMQKSFATANMLVDYQKKLSHRAYLADILFAGTQSPNEDVFINWQFFLLSLEPLIEKQKISENKILNLKKMLYALEKTDSLATFMTLFFHHNKTDDPLQTLDNLLNLFSEKDEKAIEDLLAYHKEIIKTLDNLEDFANPEKFEKAFNDLEIHVSNLCNDKAFDSLLTQDGWESASPVSKNIAIKIMNILVDVYDKAIKTMKASQSFEPTLKVKLFKEMLLPYFESLRFLTINLIDGGTFQDWIKKLNMMDHPLRQPHTDSSELYPSFNFNVAMITLDREGRDWQFNPGAQTLEDIFTLIHQNYLIINAQLTSQLLDKETISRSLPKNLINIIDRFKQQMQEAKLTVIGYREQQAQAKLIGIDVNQKQIVVKYNIPLRSHSSSLIFVYNRKTKTIEIEASFFGVNEQARWDAVKEGSEMLDQLKILPLKKPVKFHAKSVTVTWGIKPENPTNNSEMLLKFYQSLIEYSVNFTGLKNIRNFFNPIIKKMSLFELINLQINYPFVLSKSELLLREKIREADDATLSELVKTLKTKLQTGSEEIVQNILEAFILLVKERKCISKIIDIAHKGMRNSYSAIPNNFFELFKEIVINTNNIYTQVVALNLYQKVAQQTLLTIDTAGGSMTLNSQHLGREVRYHRIHRHVENLEAELARHMPFKTMLLQSIGLMPTVSNR